jgi:hypothetical protein
MNEMFSAANNNQPVSGGFAHRRGQGGVLYLSGDARPFRAKRERKESVFTVWFEGHSEGLVVAPSLPLGTESQSSMTMSDFLRTTLA